MTDAPRTRRPWRLRVTVVVALVVGALGAASGAYAAWSAQVSATGSVTAGRVAATLDGNLASVLTNSQMTTTRSVTLTNTTAGSSTQPAQTSVRFALVSGDATLASSTTVQVWPTTTATQCTAAAAVGAGSKQATWAAGVTMTSSLVRGQSTAYCVRTTAGVGVGSETGTRSLVASATGTVSVGTFSATPPPVSATISTSGIRPYITYPGYWLKNKPYGQSLCLDVTGGVNAAPGAALGTYTCHGQNTSPFWNQHFSMVDVGGQYALLTARAPTGTVLQATGSGVTLATRDVAAVNQRWSTQWLTTNTWQYVNLGTGMCLTAPSTAGAVTMSPCTGASNQAFVLETAGTVGTQDPDVVLGEAQAEAVASSPADAGTSDHLVADSPSTEDVPADGAELTGPGPTEQPTDVLDLTDGTTAVEGSTEVEGGTQSDEPAAQPEETTNGPEPDLLEDTDRG